jgi:hypothetical protein
MRASYRAAIEWIALNDDVDLGDIDSPIITICLVADLWGKEAASVLAAVKTVRQKVGRNT